MIYRPAEAALGMWDVWILPHEGKYHLFHLQSRRPDRNDEVGRAVSDDLINWETLPPILLRGKPGEWDGEMHKCGLRTGYTTVVPGGFAMTYGSVFNGREMVGVAFSKDMVHWEKCPGNPVLCAGGPWYEHDKAESAMLHIAWRDPFIEPIDGGYQALLCARSSCGDHGARACVARAFTRDFIAWDICPPLTEPGRYNSMECPERFELDGRWYLTFSTGTEWGRPLNTPGRKETQGVYYMVSDRRDGPYVVPEEDLLVGAQLISSALGAPPEYAARTLPGPDGKRLLYGMNIGERTTFSAPKVVEADSRGRLSLKFWKELLCLEAGSPAEGFSSLAPMKMGSVQVGRWDIEADRVVVESGPDTAIAAFPQTWDDLHWTCSLTPRGCERVALLVRLDENSAGTALVLDFRENAISLAGVGRGNQFGIVFTPCDVIHRNLTQHGKYAIRALARDEFIEFYLNDELLFSAGTRKRDRRGRLGFAILGRAEMTAHRVAALKPLS